MKTAARSAPRTLASIRQLCSMGLAEELFIVKLLEVLPDWVFADTCHFVWVDRDTLQPVNYSGDGFTQLGAVRRFFHHTSRIDYPGLLPVFPEAMRTCTSGRFGCEGPEVETYLQSAMYQDVMRSFDGRYMLYMVVRDAGNRPRGLLSLLRRPNDKPFTDADRIKLVQLEPYLRHALAESAAAIAPCEASDGEGLAVLDQGGNLRFQDEDARRLMWLATHERIDGKALIHLDAHGITPQLQRMHQRLAGIFEGRHAGPPAFEVSNSWGRFVFRGTWLQGCADAIVGVRVTHYIPRALKAWKGIHKLELAPRQQQVALLYSEGRTVAEISGDLNISRHTVADYVEVIYNRLAISPTREALQEVLLA